MSVSMWAPTGRRKSPWRSLKTPRPPKPPTFLGPTFRSGLPKLTTSTTAPQWGGFLQGGAMPGAGSGGNYGGAISGMPDLSALESLFAAQSREDAAARDAALRRLVISYGQAPNFDAMGISDQTKGFLKNALDAKTLELAAKAEAEGLSVHARQARENEINNRRIPAFLAGRGILRSGQTGYDLGEQAQAYKTQSYDTLNELLSNVEGSVGRFLQAERDRQMALAEARMQAAWDAANAYGDDYLGEEPPVTGGAPKTAGPKPPKTQKPRPRPAYDHPRKGLGPKTKRRRPPGVNSPRRRK